MARRVRATIVRERAARVLWLQGVAYHSAGVSRSPEPVGRRDAAEPRRAIYDASRMAHSEFLSAGLWRSDLFAGKFIPWDTQADHGRPVRMAAVHLALRSGACGRLSDAIQH